MRQRPAYKKLAEFFADKSLSEMKEITLLDAKKCPDVKPMDLTLWWGGIKILLVRDLEAVQREQRMNELVDKLLLSAAAITQDEARLAVERIFEEREK